VEPFIVNGHKDYPLLQHNGFAGNGFMFGTKIVVEFSVALTLCSQASPLAQVTSFTLNTLPADASFSYQPRKALPVVHGICGCRGWSFIVPGIKKDRIVVHMAAGSQ
jgi:hypothetical protein